jgi:hypothetical protein
MNPGSRQRIAGGWKRWGLLTAALMVCSVGLSANPNSLEEGFRRVPDRDKPWVYWWWLKGNVDEPMITRDLKAMKQAGFGGLLMFDARGYHEDHVVPPPSQMEFMSPRWRRMLQFSLRQASQLGLKVSVNLSSCAGALKGPWLVGDDAPKQLVWCAQELNGPRQFSGALPVPVGRRFWDAALLAVKHDRPAPSLTNPWQELASPPVDRGMANEVLDLTTNLDAQGRLTWDVPTGSWTLLRYGCVTMTDHEYDVDILDPEAVEGHFNRMGRAILQDAGPLAGKTLTHFYSVSWEGAAPTWTLGLEPEFAKYRGYVLRPWLPVLAGFTVQDRAHSERFHADYYRTLGDCFRDRFYGKMQDLCHRYGLQWHSESGGPWNRQHAAFGEADQLAFLARNDMPHGEFWFMGYPVKRRQDFSRAPAMTAHIYGRPLAAAEAFTHMVQHWSAYPAALKPFADGAFCDGINQFIWHTFTASPPSLGLPGSEYFAGTHINPNVTWFPQAGPFVQYLGRCQFLLRQGRFISDVCAYAGDKPYLHWGRSTNWLEPSAIKLPPGHAYDLLNTEVLLDRLSTKDGDLVLPDGMRYRVLVVDLADDMVPPAALRKIIALRNAGATVVLGQRKPRRGISLADFPAADQEVRQGADALWGSSPTLAEALEAKGITPDFAGPFAYTHRRVDDRDIYFVSGHGTADALFRVKDQQPELWDAVSGTMREAEPWHACADGRTSVTLDLPENGSIFVVFRQAARTRSANPAIVTAPPTSIELGGPWNVRFAPGRGAPQQATFAQLVAWNQHPDPGIKYFSGAATYRRTFELTKDQASHRVRLQLGTVQCLAQVRLNGKDLGIVWTAPWSIELTGAVKTGKNELAIDVVNTWVNRLIGDAGLPPAKRITRSNLALESGPRTLKAYQGYASTDPLMSSGLLGPVRLEFWR